MNPNAEGNKGNKGSTLNEIMGWGADATVEEQVAEVTGQRGVLKEDAPGVQPRGTTHTKVATQQQQQQQQQQTAQKFELPDDVKNEFKRLKAIEERFNEIEPILKTLSKEQSQEEPKSIAETLNLPDDFVYDPDEAIKNPSSMHYQVAMEMQKRANTVGNGKTVEEIVKEAIAAYDKSKSRQSSITQTQSEFGMSDEDTEALFSSYQQRGDVDLIDLALLEPNNKKIILEAIKNVVLQNFKYLNPSSSAGGNDVINQPDEEGDEFYNFMKDALTGGEQNLF